MRKKTKTLIAIFSILFILIATITGIVVYIKVNLKPTKAFLQGSVCSEGTTYCEVTPFVVDEGAYGKSTLVKLEKEGIINDSNIVYYYNRIFGSYSFCAGYFEIPHQIEDASGKRDITLAEVLKFLATPENAHQDAVWVSLNEGDFARGFAEDIASAVTLKENPTTDIEAKKNTLLEYWNNEEVVRGYMDEYPFLTEEMFNDDVKILLEGYLFPDTYEIFEYTSCDEITRKLLDRTLEIFEKYEDDFAKSDFSIHEIFTIASMTQWESGDVVDSEKVAGVFINRLNNGKAHQIYTLGSSVTVCYAFDISFADCGEQGELQEYADIDNPYNTNYNEGLPPGPVCNPSEIAIYATLHPDTASGYYYFSANYCDGGTVFARNLAEHDRNVAKYYLACD